jgi:hypothetical protein
VALLFVVISLIPLFAAGNDGDLHFDFSLFCLLTVTFPFPIAAGCQITAGKMAKKGSPMANMWGTAEELWL